MKCNLYAIYDELGGALQGLIYNSHIPQDFVTLLNREYMVNPVHFVEHCRVYLLGTIDDETLEMEKLPVRQLVGDTKAAFAFLEKARLEAQKKKMIESAYLQEAAKNAEKGV